MSARGESTEGDGPLVRRWLDRDGATSDPSPPAWVVDLLDSAAPIRVPVALKQRMLLSLGHGRRRARSGWLRPLVVAGVLVGGSAIASAAFTDWPARVVRVCRELASPAQAAPAAVTRPIGRRPRGAVVGPGFNSDLTVQPLLPLVSAPAIPPHHAAGEPGRPRAHPHAVESEDPSLVVEATRALRVDRDPRRARLLSSRYRSQHPRGTLAEEALAIEIEAALDHGDDDVTARAATYLRLYPHGAFRALAERALASTNRR